MSPYLKINIQAEYLMDASIAFASVAAGILLFIAYYLLTFIKSKRKYRHLRNLYSDFLSEIILCETKEELMEVMQKPYVQSIKSRWFWDEEARKLLIKEIVKINKSLSGMAADNILWLYVHLELYTDSLKRLRSRKWYVKAKAIQELAAMNQMEHLSKIYKETNNKDIYIRKEAQLAVVKLTGIDGLRFLNVLWHPISQWQQICLLEQLPEYAPPDGKKVRKWLGSENDSVVELALRLIERFNLFDFHEATMQSLMHPSPLVQRQASRTLVVIQQEKTASQLIDLFSVATPVSQRSIVLILKEISAERDLPFWLSLTANPEEDLRLTGNEMVKRLSHEPLPAITDGLAFSAPTLPPISSKKNS